MYFVSEMTLPALICRSLSDANITYAMLLKYSAYGKGTSLGSQCDGLSVWFCHSYSKKNRPEVVNVNLQTNQWHFRQIAFKALGCFMIHHNGYLDKITLMKSAVNEF